MIRRGDSAPEDEAETKEIVEGGDVDGDDEAVDVIEEEVEDTGSGMCGAKGAVEIEACEE